MFRKIKLTVVAVLLLCVATSTHANQTFKIEDYVPLKFTDLIWRLNGNAGGSTSDTKNYTEGEFYPVNINNRDNTRYSFRLNSFMSYRDETLDRQLKTSISVSSSFYSSSSKFYTKTENGFPVTYSNINRNDYSNKNSPYSIYPAVSYKKYLKNNLFYNASVNATFRYDVSIKDNRISDDYNYNLSGSTHYYSISHSERIRNYDNRFYFVTSEFTLGDGRQYIGSYAFKTYNLIEELKAKNLLLKQPDKTTLIALTEVIYQQENKHYFDRRLKEIEKYDEIYSFLLKHDIVKENQHLGMLLVQDAFEMFPKDIRKFGFTKSFGVGLNLNYQSLHESTFESTQQLSYRYETSTPQIIDTAYNTDSNTRSYRSIKSDRLWKYFVANLSYEKPLNMKWQVGLLATARYYFDSYEINSYSYNASINKKYDFDFLMKKDYFYNSRTIWRSSILYTYSKYEADLFDNNSLGSSNRDDGKWNFSINSSLEYRLSIPTNLTANVSYNNSDAYAMNYNGLNNIETTQFNFSLSLSHYIY